MDYSSSKALHSFILFDILNGKIDSETYFYLFGDQQLTYDEQQKMLHHHYRNFYGMLSMLTLYDEIILSPINGMLQLDESLLDELGIHYSSKDMKNKKLRWGKAKKNSFITAEEAESIVRKNKKKILADFEQEKAYYDYWIDYKFDLSDSFEYYLERCFHFDILPGSNSPRPNCSWGRTPWHLLKTGEYIFRDYLDSTFRGLASSINDQDGTFCSSLFVPNNCKFVNFNDHEKINNFVMMADFSAGIAVIPYPETIQEVIKCRKYKDLQSFRSIFSDWVHVMRNGDIDLVNKIKLDVRIANERLRKLDKFTQLDKNIMIAFIKFPVSKIPFIDVLLATSDYIKTYVTDYEENQNSWVNLPAFNPNFPYFRNLKHRKE